MKHRLLTPGEAKRSLASRLNELADRGRSLNARLGFRPYLVFLTWTKWTGDERGEGRRCVVRRCPLLPVPMVEDLTALASNPFSAGKYPVGSIRVREISGRYTVAQLEGRMIPEEDEEEVPQPYEFFYEIVEDGRHEANPRRQRFRPASAPFFDAENQQWVIVLERTSGDMGTDGRPENDDEEPAPPDPWRSRELEAPSDDEEV